MCALCVCVYVCLLVCDVCLHVHSVHRMGCVTCKYRQCVDENHALKPSVNHNDGIPTHTHTHTLQIFPLQILFGD